MEAAQFLCNIVVTETGISFVMKLTIALELVRKIVTDNTVGICRNTT